MDGGRSDPEWAWYWQAVDKETACDAKGSMDVIANPLALLFIQERVEAQYGRPSPYDAPVRKDFRRIVRWLPLPEREIIAFAYKAGRPRGLSMYRAFNKAHEQDLTQQLWSLALKRAEEWVVHLGTAYKSAGPKGDLRGALKRVEWPDILSAYVDAGSTAKASRMAGCEQGFVYRRVKAMAETEPMIEALMAFHRPANRDQAKKVRHRVHPKRKRKFTK